MQIRLGRPKKCLRGTRITWDQLENNSKNDIYYDNNMNSQIRYEINQLLLHFIILELQVVSVTSNGNIEIKIRPIVEKKISAQKMIEKY